MFPVTFQSRLIPKKCQHIVKIKTQIYTKLWKGVEKYLMNPTISICLLDCSTNGLYYSKGPTLVGVVIPQVSMPVEFVALRQKRRSARVSTDSYHHFNSAIVLRQSKHYEWKKLETCVRNCAMFCSKQLNDFKRRQLPQTLTIMLVVKTCKL